MTGRESGGFAFLQWRRIFKSYQNSNASAVKAVSEVFFLHKKTLPAHICCARVYIASCLRNMSGLPSCG